MNKEEWKECLKKLEELLKTAQKNLDLALAQKEELEFNISNYKKKIETFK